MNARRAMAATATLAMAAAVGVCVAAPASAKGGGSIRTTGACSTGGHWKLKAGPEGSRIEVQYEVEAGRVGQAWAVTVTDNGVRVLSTTRRTAGASPSFELRTLVPNRAGSDQIVATARNTVSGDVCRGALTFAG